MESDINQIKCSLLRIVLSNRNFAIMDIERLKCGHCESRIEFLIEFNYNLHSPMWLMSPHWTVAALENKILLSQEIQSISENFTLL